MKIRTRIFCFIYLILTIIAVGCGKSDKIEADEKVETQQPSAVDSSLGDFVWMDNLCEYKCLYDKKLYTKEQLENCYKLWFDTSDFDLQQDAVARRDGEESKLDEEKLVSEYREKRSALVNLKIVQDAFWENLRQKKIKEMDQVFEVKRITIRAYENPKVLLGNKFSDKCSEYAQALASADTLKLLNAWGKLAEIQAANNGDPDQVMRTYRSRLASDQKLEYAKRELMVFGWWNCGNGQIDRVSEDGSGREAYEKLFVKIESECDEP